MSTELENLKKGKKRLEWAKQHMNVLARISERLIAEKPFQDLKVSMALHVEAKTGILALILKEAGAKVRLASCNPLSTDNSVAEALNSSGIETFAKKGLTKSEYYENLNKVLDLEPDFIIDDGADLIYLTHTSRKELLKELKGANEETTTGIMRVKALERAKKLKFPVIAVNNAYMKYLFDNRYGTGQSTIDGIMSATNLLLAGKKVVIAGYGWCGRGIALRARGMGANVIITEVNPIRALEAKLEGFEVMPMMDAVKEAELIISSTGCKNIISKRELGMLKNGCILANAGHFDVEISKEALDKYSISKRRVRDFVDEYKLWNGNKVYLISEGRLVNLSVGQGHPVEIMDLSFSLQALCLEYFKVNYENLEPKVYNVPQEIDDEVAELKLLTMNITIDRLTTEQKKYLESWEESS
jgi:adenosylhomocysteinase